MSNIIRLEDREKKLKRKRYLKVEYIIDEQELYNIEQEKTRLQQQLLSNNYTLGYQYYQTTQDSDFKIFQRQEIQKQLDVNFMVHEQRDCQRRGLQFLSQDDQYMSKLVQRVNKFGQILQSKKTDKIKPPKKKKKKRRFPYKQIQTQLIMPSREEQFKENEGIQKKLKGVFNENTINNPESREVIINSIEQDPSVYYNQKNYFDVCNYLKTTEEKVQYYKYDGDSEKQSK